MESQKDIPIWVFTTIGGIADVLGIISVFKQPNISLPIFAIALTIFVCIILYLYNVNAK